MSADDVTLRCSACGDETQATRGCYSPKCSQCGGPRVETRTSAIEDLRKAREAVYGGVWTWERHGDGWALYVDRGQPLDPTETGPFVSRQHGLNILSVGSDGFDSRGEQLRAFILAAAHVFHGPIERIEAIALQIVGVLKQLDEARGDSREYGQGSARRP